MATFDVKYEETLSTSAAEELAEPDPSRWLVAFNRSSPRARAVLRDRGFSYASAAGEVYVHAPPVHVEIPSRRAAFRNPAAERSSAFAIRASRVPRWMLLHPEAKPSVSQLGVSLDLNPSVVSRAVRALADEALVELSLDRQDSRRRRIALRQPGALLEAFERASSARRISQRTWEIGSSHPEKALQRLRRAAKRTALPYAIGGLAGAAKFAKVVEPATVDVWIRKEDLEVWTEELEAFPSRQQPGAVTFRALPDPFVLSLGWRRDDLWIADPVQLFLDCRRAGERAIDAAEAIRSEMNW